MRLGNCNGNECMWLEWREYPDKAGGVNGAVRGHRRKKGERESWGYCLLSVLAQLINRIKTKLLLTAVRIPIRSLGHNFRSWRLSKTINVILLGHDYTGHVSTIYYLIPFTKQFISLMHIGTSTLIMTKWENVGQKYFKSLKLVDLSIN